MDGAKCSCARFTRLEGASVPAYAKAFLEEDGSAPREGPRRYRCRVCGAAWERRAPGVKAAGTRPSLVRVG